MAPCSSRVLKHFIQRWWKALPARGSAVFQTWDPNVRARVQGNGYNEFVGAGFLKRKLADYSRHELGPPCPQVASAPAHASECRVCKMDAVPAPLRSSVCARGFLMRKTDLSTRYLFRQTQNIGVGPQSPYASNKLYRRDLKKTDTLPAPSPLL